MSGNIVIVGAGGRLGKALQAVCPPNWTMRALTRNDLDLAEPASVRSSLEPLEYDLLLLTAALTDVDFCETNPDLAYRLNAEAVEEIAGLSADKGARVIHFSTDYVFDGQAGSPYSEDAATHPLSVYGKSKLAGEERVLGVSKKNLIIRLAWLFGPEKRGFPDWVVEQACEKDELSIVSDRVASPSYTEDIAAALPEFFFGDLAIGGILHLCNTGVCSWHEWAQACLDCAADCGVPLKAREAGQRSMADLEAFVAERPRYSALSTEKYKSLTGKQLPSWRDAVERYIRQTVAPRFIG